MDGFRALAIIPVIFFHYFSRWTPPLYDQNLYPYEAAYRDFPLFRYGFLGVEFFFVISGFVISMTLLVSKGAFDFTIKRIARLWPAMLLCSFLTFAVLKIIPQTFFDASIKNFIPSLLFFEPYFLSKILKQEFAWMDGAYWSLFVEVRFYFWAAILYFSFKNKFLEVFFGFSTLAVLLFVLGQTTLPVLRSPVEYALFPRFMPLFAMGIAFYHLYIKQKEKFSHFIVLESWVLLALQAAFFNASGGDVAVSSILMEILVYTAVVAAFYLFIYQPHTLAFFSWKPICSIGAASYSLYLLHQNAGVALIHFLTMVTRLPGELIAIVIMASFVLIAIGIYRYWENPGKKIILKFLLPEQKNKTSL